MGKGIRRGGEKKGSRLPAQKDTFDGMFWGIGRSGHCDS